VRPPCLGNMAKSENEKRALIDLACTWAQAALASERVWTPNYNLVAARRWVEPHPCRVLDQAGRFAPRISIGTAWRSCVATTRRLAALLPSSSNPLCRVL
jgi:hypothetical protein